MTTRELGRLLWSGIGGGKVEWNLLMLARFRAELQEYHGTWMPGGDDHGVL